jgi:phosphate transport system substrate-binding protein
MHMVRRPIHRATRVTTALLATIAIAALAACGGSGDSGSAARPADTIVGAGATFPYPLYSQWAKDYANVNGIKLNYQPIGSGGGISAIEADTVDFGASDAPLTTADLQTNKLVQFPTCVGGVVLVVNISGVANDQLKLTPDTLAAIYAGTITNWNDPALAVANPGLKLPDLAITPVHRADSSGTTWIFSHYLTAAAPTVWTLGADKQINWPGGVGGQKNDGVATAKQVDGAIGYVEYAYAKQNAMATAELQNKDGKFVAPSLAGFAAAAAHAVWNPAEGFGTILVDQAGPSTWPISGASFVLIRSTQTTPDRAKMALDFFAWAYANGSNAADTLDYVPMPQSVVKQIEASWSQITSNGTPVWK